MRINRLVRRLPTCLCILLERWTLLLERLNDTENDKTGPPGGYSRLTLESPLEECASDMLQSWFF